MVHGQSQLVSVGFIKLFLAAAFMVAGALSLVIVLLSSLHIHYTWFSDSSVQIETVAILALAITIIVEVKK